MLGPCWDLGSHPGLRSTHQSFPFPVVSSCQHATTTRTSSYTLLIYFPLLPFLSRLSGFFRDRVITSSSPRGHVILVVYLIIVLLSRLGGAFLLLSRRQPACRHLVLKNPLRPGESKIAPLRRSARSSSSLFRFVCYPYTLTVSYTTFKMSPTSSDDKGKKRGECMWVV